MTFDINKFKSRRAEAKIKHVVEGGQTYAIRNGRRSKVKTLKNHTSPNEEEATGKAEAFAKVTLGFAAAASKATRTPAALVWVYLVHVAWKTKSATVLLPNKWLERRGVSREIKRRALRDLEAAGLIAVDRTNSKSPRITIRA